METPARQMTEASKNDGRHSRGERVATHVGYV
jgi:hypothetical protein